MSFVNNLCNPFRIGQSTSLIQPSAYDRLTTGGIWRNIDHCRVGGRRGAARSEETLINEHDP
jgi:hypothetical protein